MSNNKIRLHQIQRIKGAKSPISQLLFTTAKLNLQDTKSNSVTSKSNIKMKIICCPKISSIGQETKRESQFEVGCYGWIFDCEFLSFFSLLAAEKLSLKNLKIRPKIGLYLPNKNGLMRKNGLVQIGLLFIHIRREKGP